MLNMLSFGDSVSLHYPDLFERSVTSEQPTWLNVCVGVTKVELLLLTGKLYLIDNGACKLVVIK